MGVEFHFPKLRLASVYERHGAAGRGASLWLVSCRFSADGDGGREEGSGSGGECGNPRSA